MEGISFFSESDMTVDKNGHKRVSSEYPLWYNRQMIDELREDIGMAQFEIKSGRIKDTQLTVARDRLSKLQSRMEEIEKSMPKLEGKEIDKFSKVRKDLGKEISTRMFTRSEMKKGLSDAHEEVRRMTMPSIPLTGDMAEVVTACNVKPVDGKISRTQAEKVWKIVGRYMDESSNTESLRRD